MTSVQASRLLASRASADVEWARCRSAASRRGVDQRASAEFKVDRRRALDHSLSIYDVLGGNLAPGGFVPGSRLTVGAGVRHEWRAAPRRGSARATTVGHGTATFEAMSGTTRVLLRGSLAASHRWPTLNELVRNFQVGAIRSLANPDLRPERARGGDVGVVASQRLWNVTATFFHTVVHDAIANVTTSTNIRQRQNAGDAVSTGFEIDGELKPVRRVRIGASATFTDATFQDSLEPALEGNRLPQVPKRTFVLLSDATVWRSIVVSGILRTTSSQFDDDRNQFELEPATQLDLRVAGRSRAFGWYLVWENVGDARIEVGRTPLVTLAPGQAVRVGINWRLGN